MASDDDDPRDERDDDSGERREDRVIEKAKARVKIPAIMLLVVGLSGGFVALIFAMNIFTMDAQFEAVEKQWDNDPNLKPEQKKEMKQVLADMKGPIKIFLPLITVCGLLTTGLTTIGAIQIMKLKSRGLGMASSVISMIPVVGGWCCCLGLPVGIWVMIVLGHAEVKAGFAAVARGSNNQEYDR